MTLPLHFALYVELALVGLLAVTLIYCAVLERRLAAIRKGQDALKDTIGELNTAIAAAGQSLTMLKSAANGAAKALDERLAAARRAIDELSPASQPARGVQSTERRVEIVRRDARLPSGSIMNRLDALKAAR